MRDRGSMEIRAARAEEADDVLRVLCAAFSLPYQAARPIFHRDPFFDLSHKRLLRTVADGIVSCLTVVPAQIRVGHAWVPLAGIAGVATHPDFRQRGYAGQLLAATVPALSEEFGYPLSGLFTESAPLYRRFGWETAIVAVRYSIPLAALPSSAEDEAVRPVRLDPERLAVRSLHASTAGMRTGGFLRDERRWQLIETAAGHECAVYQSPGEPVSGYAFWERQETVLHLLEMRAATGAARQGLLGHLARQAAPGARLEHVAAPDQWSALCLPLAGAEALPVPGLMLRLTDLRAALAAVHEANFASALASAGCALTLHATDPLCPENNLPVRLAASAVTLGSVTDTDWLRGPISAFAPIYLGLQTPSEALAAGQFQASSPAALALADQLFPHRHPFVAPLDQF